MFLKDLASVGSVIISIITKQAFECIKNKVILEKITKQMTACILACEKKYTGTIIDSDILHGYLTDHKIIQRFMEFYKTPYGVRCGKSVFIEKQTENCITYIEKSSRVVSVKEELLIKELFSNVFNVLEENVCKNLTLNEKVFQANMLSGIKSFIDAFDKNISRRMDNQDEILKTIRSCVEQNNLEQMQIQHAGIIKQDGLSYEVTIRDETARNPFVVETWVKANDEINKFNDTQKYLNYMFWAGEDVNLEVVKHIAKRNGQICIESEISPAFTGPAYKLPSFYAEEFSTDKKFILQKDSYVEMHLHIPAQRTKMSFNIENENHDVIETCDFELTRKIENGVIVTTYNDIRNNPNTNIKFVAKMIDNKITDFIYTISPIDGENALSILLALQLEHKMITADKIIFRDLSSGQAMMSAKITKDQKTIQHCKNKIEILKKIIFIQDYFKFTFKIPKKIEIEDQQYLIDIYHLLKDGIAYSSAFTLTFNMDLTSKNDIHVGQAIMFTHTMKDYNLFNQTLDFKQITAIYPNTTLTSRTKEKYTLKASQPCIFIWDSKYGEFDIWEVAKKEMEKIK